MADPKRRVLRGGSTRLSIEFGAYEAEDSARIVHHLRSVLRREIQKGWNLFAYKTALFQRKSVSMKPGPDEILIRRERWDRYLVPSLVMASLAGIGAWRIAGQSGFLAAPIVPLVGWVLLRFTTPAGGLITKKLSLSADPDTVRFLGCLVVWWLVGIAVVSTHEVFRNPVEASGPP